MHKRIEKLNNGHDTKVALAVERAIADTLSKNEKMDGERKEWYRERMRLVTQLTAKDDDLREAMKATVEKDERVEELERRCR